VRLNNLNDPVLIVLKTMLVSEPVYTLIHTNMYVMPFIVQFQSCLFRLLF